jgi:hypothetical protein
VGIAVEGFVKEAGAPRLAARRFRDFGLRSSGPSGTPLHEKGDGF